jgi:hypothetical protein
MRSYRVGDWTRALWVAGALLISLPNALAVVRPPPVSPYDDDVAAVPEPQILLMLASGLGLAGVYVIYRIRKNTMSE